MDKLSIKDFNVPATYQEDNGPYTVWIGERRFRLVFYFCVDTWQIYETFENGSKKKLAEAPVMQDCINDFNDYLNGTAN